MIARVHGRSLLQMRGRWILLLAGLLLSSFARGADKESARDSSGDELFTNTVGIRRLSIEISGENIEKLRKYNRRRGGMIQEREDVPGTVREGNLVWTNVAIHLKGAAGSFLPIDHKPALTLNFDKFTEGQRFHGLEKISVNNSVQDPTYVHEKLCREIYAAAGMPVPRADYAMVELNGRALGLYVLLEGWNKQFLRRHFSNVRGNLYDGAFSRDITSSDIPVNSGKEPENHTALRALCAACEIRSPAERLTRLKELLDLDRFYTLLALDAMMWNWDGYPFNRNNYRAFHNLESGRFVFMPHGMDQMFSKPDGPILTGTKGVVARAVLQIPECRRRVLDRIAELRSKLFDPETLTKRVDQLAERNRVGVAESGFGSAIRHSAEVKVLRDRIVQRVASIDEQLLGAQKLLPLKPSQTAALGDWRQSVRSGNPRFSRTADTPAALHINATNGNCSAAWVTTVWLEEGTYRVSARVKTHNIVPATGEENPGAGLQVWSHRKDREGPNWEWFPHRNSRNLATRGEIPPVNESPRLTGTTAWADVAYEFELRQPMADLEIRCLLEGSGEARFDPASLKITCLSSEVSNSGGPRR